MIDGIRIETAAVV